MALAFTFTSCKNKDKCWKVTVESEYSGKSKFYVWASENDMDAIVGDLEDVADDVKYEKADKSESDCDQMDDLEDLQEELEYRDKYYGSDYDDSDYDDWY